MASPTARRPAWRSRAAAYPGSGATITGVGFYDVSQWFSRCGCSHVSLHLQRHPDHWQLQHLCYRHQQPRGDQRLEPDPAFSATNAITVSSIVRGTRGPIFGQPRRNPTLTSAGARPKPPFGRVRFGTTPGSLAAYADDTAGRPDHGVTLTGLRPETKYYYSIGTTAGTICPAPITISPPHRRSGPAGPRASGFCSDYGQCRRHPVAVRDTYLNYIATNGRGTTCGLPAATTSRAGRRGRRRLQTTCSTSIPTSFRTRRSSPAPAITTVAPPAPTGAFTTFPTRGRPAASSGNAHYYSFDYGNIHFVSLDVFNASTDVGSPMLMWLTNDLARPPNRGSSPISTPRSIARCFTTRTPHRSWSMRQNFAPIFEAYGVDLVLSGHSHSLQRTYLLNQHYGVSSTFSPTTRSMAAMGARRHRRLPQAGPHGHGVFRGADRLRRAAAAPPTPPA